MAHCATLSGKNDPSSQETCPLFVRNRLQLQPLFWDDGFGGKRGKKELEGISGTRISKVYITPRVAFVFIQLFISLLQVIIILSANEPPMFQRASEKIQTNAEASVSCEAQNSPVFFFFFFKSEFIYRQMCFQALSRLASSERSQHIFSEPEQSSPH